MKGKFLDFADCFESEHRDPSVVAVNLKLGLNVLSVIGIVSHIIWRVLYWRFHCNLFITNVFPHVTLYVVFVW